MPQFKTGDQVVVREECRDSFPSTGHGPWAVESVEAIFGNADKYGYTVTLTGFNIFHESWFRLLTIKEQKKQ